MAKKFKMILSAGQNINPRTTITVNNHYPINLLIILLVTIFGCNSTHDNSTLTMDRKTKLKWWGVSPTIKP